MIGLVLCGHNRFGEGLYSALELIAGQPADCEVVTFLEGEGNAELVTKFKAAYDKLSHCDGIIVLADLAGGGPFKIAVEVSLDYPNVRVMGGTNLPLLIEMSFARQFESDIDKLISNAITTGQQQIVVFSQSNTRHEDDNFEDGI